MPTQPHPVIGQALSRCEQCGRQAAAVIESDRKATATRRRKACRHCGHRFTDYELSAAEYQRLISAAAALEKVRQIIDIDKPSQNFNSKIPCGSCEYGETGKCSFDYPEFNSTEASDCSMFEQIKNNTTRC